MERPLKHGPLNGCFFSLVGLVTVALDTPRRWTLTSLPRSELQKNIHFNFSISVPLEAEENPYLVMLAEAPKIVGELTSDSFVSSFVFKDVQKTVAPAISSQNRRHKRKMLRKWRSPAGSCCTKSVRSHSIPADVAEIEALRSAGGDATSNEHLCSQAESRCVGRKAWTIRHFLNILLENFCVPKAFAGQPSKAIPAPEQAWFVELCALNMPTASSYQECHPNFAHFGRRQP